MRLGIVVAGVGPADQFRVDRFDPQLRCRFRVELDLPYAVLFAHEYIRHHVLRLRVCDQRAGPRMQGADELGDSRQPIVVDPESAFYLLLIPRGQQVEMLGAETQCRTQVRRVLGQLPQLQQ